MKAHADKGPPSSSGLELKNLGKAFGPHVAVDRISLTIAPGEFVALLGPSGSGKTTTLMMIAGFVAPDHGEVCIGGVDVTALPAHRRNLGMVYQNYALFPHMTVAGNIAFPLEMRGVKREEIRRRVDAALDLVQLPDKGNQFPRQLSGGQQQRVALARALVFEPPILLMDEPLGALDKKLRVEMQQEIKALQRTLRITTIYVTHDQEEALSMADRVVVMHAGQILQIATPTELYDRPANAFVAEFIGAANLLSATVVRTGATTCVRTAAGLTFDVAASGLRQGATVGIVLRPERIRLQREGEGSHAGHIGQIADAAFAGGLWRYRLLLGTGDSLMVTQSNLGSAPFEVGDVVAAAFSPADAWVIATAEASGRRML
jgi:putative spermidine/putrescine transport system ATP-binding protein